MVALTKLENVLRQDVLSTTFDLTIPEWGGAFVSGGMCDAFGSGGTDPSVYGASSAAAVTANANANSKRGPQRVLGCVEIGLVCKTRVGMRGVGLMSPVSPVTPSPIAGTLSAGGRLLNGNGSGSGLLNGGAQGGQVQKPEVVYEERLLLLPKVVLESVVDLL